MEATMLVPPLRFNKTKYNKKFVKFSLLNGWINNMTIKIIAGKLR